MLSRLLERGKTSGREDDNVESIKKRFRTSSILLTVDSDMNASLSQVHTPTTLCLSSTTTPHKAKWPRSVSSQFIHFGWRSHRVSRSTVQCPSTKSTRYPKRLSGRSLRRRINLLKYTNDTVNISLARDQTSGIRECISRN